MSEQYEGSAWQDKENQRLNEIFGAERMERTKGNEAGPETARQFQDIITTLCLEPAASVHYDIRTRVIGAKDGAPLIVRTNRSGMGGFGDNIVDRSRASLDNLKAEIKKVRTGFLPSFIQTYKDKEALFLDGEGKLKIQKVVTIKDKRGAKQKMAYKPASEEEVAEAMGILFAAVQYDDEVRAKKITGPIQFNE